MLGRHWYISRVSDVPKLREKRCSERMNQKEKTAALQYIPEIRIRDDMRHVAGTTRLLCVSTNSCLTLSLSLPQQNAVLNLFGSSLNLREAAVIARPNVKDVRISLYIPLVLRKMGLFCDPSIRTSKSEDAAVILTTFGIRTYATFIRNKFIGP
jgi:hypothetical protein